MEAIKLHLEKFRRLSPPDDELKTLLLTAIKEELGATLDKKAISFQGLTVFLRAPAALKAEIYLHQEAILERLHHLASQTNLEKLI